MKNPSNYLFTLILVYFCYIIIALPQQSFGVSWPRISLDLSIPLEKGGLIVAANSLSAALASFLIGHLLKKINIPFIIISSFILATISVWGYSQIDSFYKIFALSIPLGFAGGAIAITINSYAAHNFTPKHMNFIHGYWAIGAAIGSGILTYTINHNNSWKLGYEYFVVVNIFMIIALLLSTKTWKKDTYVEKEEKEHILSPKSSKILSSSALLSIAIFFLEAPLEIGISVWLSSILMKMKDFPETFANSMVVVYWGCIMIGRFGAGFISTKIANRKMISYSQLGALAGILLLTFSNHYTTIPAVILIGLSVSSLYPSMMHETSKRFSKNISSIMIGYQATASLLGSTIVIPIIGLILTNNTMFLFPFLLTISICVCIFNNILNRKVTSS